MPLSSHCHPASEGILERDGKLLSARQDVRASREKIEVICIHCQTGRDLETDEALERFTLSNISSMDGALAATLERRGFSSTATGAESLEGCFANHCPHCGAVQEDYLLHSEPGDVFFSIAEAERGSIEFTAVEGRIRVSGDCGFGV